MKKLIAVVAAFISVSASAQWKYESTKDPMTDRVDRSATLPSATKVQLPFPYAGGTTAFIHIQPGDDGDSESSVVVGLDKGQILKDEGVDVRLDDGAIISFRASGAASGSTKIAFLRFPGERKDCSDACSVTSAELIDGMAKSKRMKLQLTVYDHGAKVFEFKPQGLKWAQERQL
jgi:hypothetical protein